MLSVHVVFWCIISSALCKTWSDYFWDLNGCRFNGAFDCETLKYLNCVPFMQNFHKGNRFLGLCEFINAFMIVISILAVCCSRCAHHFTNPIAGCIASFTVLLDIAKVVYMIEIGVDIYEVVIIIISIALCCNCKRTNGDIILPVLVVTIVTGALEIHRDVHSSDRDGNHCPLF